MEQTLGVVVPMSAEAGFIFGWKRWQPSNNQKIKIISTHSGIRFLCVRSGVGAENAAVAAGWLVDHGVAALAVVGVSGGLDPALRIGDLVIPEIVVQAGQGGIRDKRVSDGSIADPIISLLMSKGITVHRGILLTAANPALTPREKSALFITYDAQAVDMESASVFRVAHDQNLPFLVIRSICDTATTDIPTKLFQSLNPKGSLCWSRLLTAVLLHPFLFPRIIRIGGGFFRALIALKNAWQLLLKHHRLLSIPEEQ
jgi:adenosylhomocysteine nucleosidase